MIIEQMAVYKARVVFPILRQSTSADGERKVEADYVVVDHLSISERRRVSVGERVIDVHRTR